MIGCIQFINELIIKNNINKLPIMKTTKVYKKAFNRGNARIWIEGNILNSHGFQNGMRFVKEFIDEDQLLLSFTGCFEDLRTHKIAGTSERPIIDLTGKYVSDFFKDAERYTCQFDSDNNAITILRGETF